MSGQLSDGEFLMNILTKERTNSTILQHSEGQLRLGVP